MWLNLRKLIVRKAYLSGSQCRLFFLLAVSIFFCESLAYSKDKRYNRNNSCHNCTRSIMLSYPVNAGLLVLMNSEVQPTTTVVQFVVYYINV